MWAKAIAAFSPAQLGHKSEVHWYLGCLLQPVLRRELGFCLGFRQRPEIWRSWFRRKLVFDSDGQAAKEAKTELPLEVIEVDVFIAAGQNQSTERLCTRGD
jgi:hypothetical protein